MEFHSTDQVRRRLERGGERLTREQLKEIATHVLLLGPRQVNRYFAELFATLSEDLVSVREALGENQEAIKQLDASTRSSLNEVRTVIERFDSASGKLSRRIYGLTWALVALTAVLVMPVLAHGVMWLVHRW